MPLDDMVDQEPRAQEWGLYRVNNWKLKLCWLPRKCYLSGKPLWGKQCYMGVRVITGPGTPVEDYYYIEKSEFLFWMLRGKK